MPSLVSAQKKTSHKTIAHLLIVRVRRRNRLQSYFLHHQRRSCLLIWTLRLFQRFLNDLRLIIHGYKVECSITYKSGNSQKFAREDLKT